MDQKSKLLNQKQKLEDISERLKKYSESHPSLNKELEQMYDEVIETIARLDTNQYTCYR